MELSTRYEIEADLTRELAAILERWRRSFRPKAPPTAEEQEEDERRLFLFFIVALAPIYYTSSRQIIDEFATDLPTGSIISHQALQKKARAAAEQRAAFVAQVMADGTAQRAADYLARMENLRRQAAASPGPEFADGFAILIRKMQTEFDWEFSRERAENVAVTETTVAQFGGQQIGRGELAERGVILDAQWITEADEKVCPICLSLDGKDESDWPDKYRDGPPAHNRCRCHVAWGLTEAETIAEEANT